MSASLRATIEDFLSFRRIAVVGVSRNEKDFTRVLFRELKQRGYDVVPVNPGAEEIEGQRCYGHVGDIEPAVEGALVLTPRPLSEAVAQECATAGVSRVWFYRSVGDGVATPEALRICEEKGMEVVPGECPFMFLSGGNWIHGVHRFCRKMIGTFPQ